MCGHGKVFHSLEEYSKLTKGENCVLGSVMPIGLNQEVTLSCKLTSFRKLEANGWDAPLAG